MAKYSFEFKMKVVNGYLKGDCGQGSLAKKYGIHHSIDDREFKRTHFLRSL